MSAGLVGLPGLIPSSRAGSANRTRLLLLGDSLVAGGFGLYLGRALGLDGYSVTRRGKPSTGLARPDFFDWHAEVPRLVERGAHDAAIVMFGGNDVQGLRMPDGSWIRWQEPGWSKEYAARVVRLFELLAADGQPVFWIGMPVVGPDKMRARVEHINRIYRAEMAIRKNGAFVETWGVLSDASGGYAHRLVVETLRDDGTRARRRVQVRGEDGVHLTVAGAQFLKDHVRSVLLRELPPPLLVPGPGP